jgi:lipoate-protein ligase A
MPHRFRLLRTGAGTAAFNMGLDEAVLESVASGSAEPTLRFYSWTPPAVTIGYFQGMEEEIDIAACARNGIDAVRRLTGGGAVLHQHEITYSVILPESHPLADPVILRSYERLCAGIVAGLARLGVAAEFAPINDIAASGRKVSGNAQTRKLGCILQHGTVLLDLDVGLMFDILKVPAEKMRGKLVADVKARVVGLAGLLGRPVGFAEAEEALRMGFASALDLDLVPAAPTAAELERARDLAVTRFSSREWNFRR